MTYLLDTNVISEVMRKDPNPQAFSWFSKLNAIPTSVICLEELVFGLRRRSLYAKEAWLRRLLADKGLIYPVSDGAAHWSGERRAAAELRGTKLHQADALIAACAWEHGLVLATRNTRDFENLGIALFNPFEQS